MTIEWGAYDTGDTNRGARIGIDAIWSAVSNTSTTVTVTWKFYVQNRYTWNNDQQELRYSGDYTGGSSTSFNNPGQSDGEINYVASRTFTYTYSASSYGASPGSLDVTAKLYNMYNGASPSYTRADPIPARPYGAPVAPTNCTAARLENSDAKSSLTWTRTVSASKPWTACWVERYIYLGPGMVAGTGLGSWTRVATLGSTTGWTDTTTVANRKYAWRVQADNSVATSGFATSGILFTTPAVPTAPTRADGAGGSQSISFVNNVGYAEYATEVWRAVDGVYALLATVPAAAMGATSTYNDLTASAAHKNKYKFRTKSLVGTALYSAYSAETTETTGIPTAPAAPTELKPATGTIDPTGPVVHSWKHNPTDGSVQTFFEVQYRHVGSSSWLTSGKIASALQTWKMPSNSVAKDNQVEWQVRTWGYSSTLAGAWSASAKWTTTPLVPLKYPLFLDVDSGRTEASSTVKLITEQTRRVATVTRVANTANATAAYNILSYTLPASLARTGRKFRISAGCNIVPDTAGMYTDLRILIGVGAVTTGTQIGANYVDHRIVGRSVGGFFTIEYVFDPASAGGENISTINIVLIGFPGGGGSYVNQAANRPAYLIIDEIIDGSSTAGGGGGLPIGGLDGQVLTKQSSANGDALWEALPPIPPTLPTGGADGMVLTKQSAADNDANWEAPPAGAGVVEPTYACSLRTNVAQTMTTSVETVMNFVAAHSVDPMGMWNGADLVTVPKDGVYTITYQYFYSATATAGGSRISIIRINGSTYRQYYHPIIANVAVQGTVAFDAFLTAGSTVQARQYQSSGADLATNATTQYSPMLTVAKTPEFAPGGGSIIVDRQIHGAWSQTAALSILSSTTTTIPMANVIDTPVGGLVNNAGSITIPEDGYYQINALVTYTLLAAGSYRYAYIMKNGVTMERAAATPDDPLPCIKLAKCLFFAAGDLLTIKVHQTSGSTVPLEVSNNMTQLDVTRVPSSYSGSAVSTYGERNYSAQYQLTAAQAIPASTVTTVLWDTQTVLDGITYASGVFTVPSAGYYEVSASAIWDSTVTTGYRQLRVLRNTTLMGAVNIGATPTNATPVVTRTILCAAGDTITVQAYTNAAGCSILAAPANNFVTITKVPAPVINGAAASGMWNVGPLAGFGSDPSIGREVYIDGVGQLRSNPDVVSGKLPTDLAPTWPVGTTVFYVPNAEIGQWPGGQCVVTHKTYNGVIAQWCYLWSAATPKAWYRNGTATGWSPWQQVVGESVPYATAAGSSAITGVTAGPMGVSLAITYPVGRFSTIPICVGSGDSNGYGFGMAAGSSQTGVTLRYYNPTASVPSGVKVNWIATQMTAASGAGLMARSAGNESTVTCHTEGCENAEHAIQLDIGDADAVACGVCNEPITDIQGG